MSSQQCRRARAGSRFGSPVARLATAGLALGLTAANATAQAGRAIDSASPNRALNADEKAFVQVAIVVMTVDRLVTRCNERTPLSSLDAATIRAWQQENRVADLRAEIDARQQNEPWRTWLPQAKRTAEDSADTINVEPCKAAVSATRVAAAQFTKSSPGVLASVPSAGPATGRPAGATASSSTAGATDQPAATSRSAPPAEPASPALLDQIDSFGFDSAAAMGIGGFITTRIYPVVLFKNGDVLTDVEGLSHPGGLAAHRRAKPKDWGKWRLNGSTIEITGSKGWEKLSFPTTYSTLPPDLRLNGLYRHLGGTGNIAVGGSDAVTAFTEYTFFPDGRVMRGSGSGAQAQGGDASTVIASTAPGRRGRYRIDGLTLTITYDDGRTESRIIVTDPKDPKGAIWLDGVGYVQRNR